MDEPMPDTYFKIMSFLMKFRDLFSPRKNVLSEVGMKPGFHVLDYGCGPGSYVPISSELVGKKGKVYALDIQPLAIKRVTKMALKKNLTNVQTIQSDCKTGLPDNEIDVALLYDIFHLLSEPDKILAEIHRVLKPNGILSVNDHHLEDDEIICGITKQGMFSLKEKGNKTINFLIR
ncbi:MAG: class I SAM-dependent methyltransferase [Thermoplasmata archaeon]|nr:MAG: class I SAM-dependent methyltransferase [Thermoplasmata archaeon]